jgi:hypothetical protein
MIKRGFNPLCPFFVAQVLRGKLPDLRVLLQVGWVPGMRLGIPQGLSATQSLRGYNAGGRCVVKEGLGSTIDMNSMSGVDEIAAIVVSVLSYLKNQKQILPLGWLVVCTLDLKAAFKQLAVDPGSFHLVFLPS